jgi:hypothetical protein
MRPHSELVVPAIVGALMILEFQDLAKTKMEETGDFASNRNLRTVRIRVDRNGIETWLITLKNVHFAKCESDQIQS